MSRTLFDWTEMARRALGRHWLELSQAEREEFAGLLGRHVDARLITSRAIRPSSGRRSPGRAGAACPRAT
ncbi:MAG: ABC transporter substrate-binding protein [Candidatus Rokuibacteriota bacterium]